MGVRTLIELNHDYSPGLRDEEKWLKSMKTYYRSGNPDDLPSGVTFKHKRHHSDPCPLNTPKEAAI